MAYSPVSGKFGYVKVGGAPYCFAKWKVDIKSNLVKVNTFCSEYQQLVPGLKSATVTVEGAYDAGNMPLSMDTLYVFTLGVNNVISFVVSVYIENIEVSDDIEDAVRITVTGQSSGEFSPSIS